MSKRRLLVGPVFAALVVGAVVIGVLLTLGARSRRNADNIGTLKQAVSRIERLERFNQRVRIQRREDYAITDREICLQLERLKKAQREAALSSFRKLPDTARLLKIPLSPALVTRARSDRDETLRRFKPLKCAELPSQRSAP